MILYYSVAKEAKYKKDDNDNYIDCAIAIAKNYISHVKDEDERKKEALKFKSWICDQIKVNQIFVREITKEQFEEIEE